MSVHVRKYRLTGYLEQYYIMIMERNIERYTNIMS